MHRSMCRATTGPGDNLCGHGMASLLCDSGVVCSVVLGDVLASGTAGTVYTGTVAGQERAVKVIT